MDFPDQLAAALTAKRDGFGAEYKEVAYSWGDLVAIGDALEAVLAEAGVPREAPVGVIARNRPFLGAAILGLVVHRRPVTMIYSAQSAEAMAGDLTKLKLAAVVADPQDWGDLQIAAAKGAGTLGLATGDLDKPIRRVDGISAMGPGPHRAAPAEPGIELLSSGTTGAPKRILIGFPMLERSVMSFTLGEAPPGGRPPQIVSGPIGNVSGLCQLIGCAAGTTPMIILEKFNVPEFVSAMRRHRPPILGLSPPAVKMLLDAKLSKEDFPGVGAVFGGGGALTPEIQEAFEAAYDIPIYWGYGATEFGGTLVRWTPDMREPFGKSKRGSIGRAAPGTDLRVVDPETGAVLPPGKPGLLEARVPLMSDDFIRTTDLVILDEDGFVFHLGRNDGAISRGGFKIMPETVAAGLRSHPAVADAAVVGIPDDRLGEVPVAAIELKAGQAYPGDETIKAHLRGRLTAVHIPTRIAVVDALPRTPSMKVSLVEVKKLFGH
ncbi:MAG TPA: class I adenylate-forming enzyme family protein [Alphaproteobacteria bacterium]|nr:class I adenylate-forming enzyme family protein [Alphaproteobacteria bacterium]